MVINIDPREEQLEQISLPAVRAGMPVRECDIRKIINSVSTLEKIYKSKVTVFPPVRSGEPLTAMLLNKIYVAASNVASKAGVSMQWSEFPVASGQPATESMFNELIGSINLVVFRAQHNDVEVGKYVLLHNMKRKLTNEKLSVLNVVWNYVLEHDRCMPSRLLFSKINIPKAKAFVESVGGSFIFETTDNGNKCYTLTFLGVMQTDSYLEIEDLLVRYLCFVKEKFEAEPEISNISNNEIDSKLQLSGGQSAKLRKIIHLAHFYSGSMGWGDGGWSVGLPEDVEELRFVEDVRSYIVAHAFKYVDMDSPVEEGERYRKMLVGRHESESNNRVGSGEIAPEAPEFLRNLVWIKKNWRNYWVYLLLMVVFLVLLNL